MSLITTTNGFYSQGRLFPTSNLDWSELASSPFGTWTNWTKWNPDPKTITVKVFEETDSIANRLPTFDFNTDGTVTAQLKIANAVDSNLSLIGGTTTSMTLGTEVTPAAGRYYEFTITIAPNSNTPTTTLGTFDFNTDEITQFIENINTATLSGTIDSRTITTNIPTVTALVVTATEAGVTYSSGNLQDRVYAIPDDYTFQENAIVTNIVSKIPPKIRCFDLNGESIDAVVDILIKGLGKIVLIAQGIVKA
jgi:hypothetical protein